MNFIEAVLGASPDRGSGLTEISIIVALAIAGGAIWSAWLRFTFASLSRKPR